jgi:AcrR family transcriptional regulator
MAEGVNTRAPLCGEVINAVQQNLDGRTERWRAHKLRQREQFVDATLRALAKHGPKVSVADIAAEAGVAKPKLYRHFDDKADLVDAVQQRISAMLWQRFTIALNPQDSLSDIVCHCLDAYLSVVDEYPDAFRLLLSNSFTRATAHTLEDGKKIAGALSAFIAGQLRVLNIDTEAAEPTGHALAGAVAAATLWWLEKRSISKKALIDHLSTLIQGSLEALARTAGVILDVDDPINLETAT